MKTGVGASNLYTHNINTSHQRDSHIVVGGARGQLGFSRSNKRTNLVPPLITASIHVMVARILLLVVLFVCGSEATPFADTDDLQSAVDACLDYDPTGMACCGLSYDSGCGDPSTARCGAAGCDEMPSWDTSLVTSMVVMFFGASTFNADISGWNTSSVTDMGGMFQEASAFNADISGWDTSLVTSMVVMFLGASTFNADISGWDTSSVTDMGGMFQEASAFNADISEWDTGSVTSMGGMFDDATAWHTTYTRLDGTSSNDGPPSAWYRIQSPPPTTTSPPFADTDDLQSAVDACLDYDPTGMACCGLSYDSGCGDPSTARCGAAGCDEMPSWDTSLVTSMVVMFFGASTFNADISGWNTSSVTDMGGMFQEASAFNADISGWDTSLVTSMVVMFLGASTFNADISGWDTSSVTDMGGMFQEASAFNADISEWDTGSVTSMGGMFNDATAWHTTYTRLDGTSSNDGPPSAWYRIQSPPPTTTSPPPPQLPQSESSTSTDNESSATRYSVVTALVVSIINLYITTKSVCH